MTKAAPTLLDALRQASAEAQILPGGVDGYAIDGVQPAAVVQPLDAEGVAAVLRLASSRGLAVVPIGGGTAADLGNLRRRVDIVLDLRRIDALLEYRPQD